jgi:hypothetical protein
MRSGPLLTIALALVALPALLNSHLALWWHSEAQLALAAIVAVNGLHLARRIRTRAPDRLRSGPRGRFNPASW